MLSAYAEKVRRSVTRPGEGQEEGHEVDRQSEQGATSVIADPGDVPDRARTKGSLSQRATSSSPRTDQPLIEKLRIWLDASIDTVPPQSLTGKAMHYMRRQWPKLVRVLDDGRVPLDTNLVENAIRPFVVGRKAWLFADSMAGARASANLYGLIETAKANRIEPSRYLAHLFEILPTLTEPEQLDDLLPQNIDPTTIGRSES